jgi:hypothetical protein
MRPHSLLFSSDEEASRALSRAFRDLEFDVETCPEIFSAVEKITTRSFDVVVSDWNEGLEAVFLLKTVRELKGNHSAFTLAIANSEAVAAAHEAGADQARSVTGGTSNRKPGGHQAAWRFARLDLRKRQFRKPGFRPRDSRKQDVREPDFQFIATPSSLALPSSPAPDGILFAGGRSRIDF